MPNKNNLRHFLRVNTAYDYQKAEAIIATLAYAAWAFALGGPFEKATYISWNATVGTLVLMAATLTLPLIDDLFLPVKES